MRGTTLVLLTLLQITPVFLSTYPVRGTTDKEDDTTAATYISIHVPRAGYDRARIKIKYMSSHFYPRTPCGVRPAADGYSRSLQDISIHVPRAGYDRI